MMTDDVGRFMFGIGGLVTHAASDEVLILKRASNHSNFNRNEWELVYGRKSHFEDIDEALRREIREEIGLEDIEVLKLVRVWHFFRGPKSPDNEIIGATFWCRTMSRSIRLSSEHSEYRWVTANDALDLVKVGGIRADLKTFIENRERLFVTLSGSDERLVEL